MVDISSGSDLVGLIISIAYCAAILVICSVQCFFKFSKLKLGIVLGTACTLLLAVGNFVRSWIVGQAEIYFWGARELINAMLVTGVALLLLSVGNTLYLKADEEKPSLWKLSTIVLLIFDIFTILEVIPLFGYLWPQPDITVYIIHQVLSLFAIFLPVFYIYAPMVRRCTEVLDAASPTTMATGVWYLIVNSAIAIMYLCIFSYYLSHPDLTFSQAAIAWYCCIEATIGGIITLPPFPPALSILEKWTNKYILARLLVNEIKPTRYLLAPHLMDGGSSPDYSPSRRRSSAMTFGEWDPYIDFLAPGVDPGKPQLILPILPLPVVVRNSNDEDSPIHRDSISLSGSTFINMERRESWPRQ